MTDSNAYASPDDTFPTICQEQHTDTPDSDKISLKTYNSDIDSKIDTITPCTSNADHFNFNNSFLAALIREHKPRLPNFYEFDFLSWKDLIKKSFEDYNITDNFDKYLLTKSTLKSQHLIKLSPFFSKGDRNDYYENLLLGMEKVFGLTLEERIWSANRLEFTDSELPSVFAEKLRTLYPKEYTDKIIQLEIRSRLPCSYRDFLDNKLKLDDYLEKADALYLNRRFEKNKTKSESFSTDRENEGISKKSPKIKQEPWLQINENITILSQNMKALSLEMSNLQKSIAQIEMGVVDTGSLNQLRISATVINKIDKTLNDILSKIPLRQRFKNQLKPQTRPKITNVSNICFEHQKWGHKGELIHCNPRCVYKKTSLCVSHKTYGYGALHCEVCEPPCQFINLTK